VRVDREPAWRFSVRDNGQGFTPAAPSADDTHVGLQIMRERAQRIGAKVDIVSRPGQGTEVQIALETP
jgi:two-component system nitrate/nitrite sensor histidine kinase NarX